jgi:hypothetical protein
MRSSKRDYQTSNRQAQAKDLPPAAPCSLPPFVQTAFVFAARYTHHRNTGGTLAVCRALAYVWPDLSESIREQILKESHEATTNLREWREFRGDEEANAKLSDRHE